MNPANAVINPVFLSFASLGGGLIVTAATVLAILRSLGRDVTHAIASFKGWLVMVPLIFGTIFLGREAVIAGVALLACFGFREFARATGLYRDWWISGIVYISIAALAVATLVTDPRLGVAGWYGIYMALPVYVISAIVLVPVLRNRAGGQLQTIALAILGFVYFGWMFMHLGLLANTAHAYAYLLFLLLAVEANDIAAYICGKIFGQHKLREGISPNKTVEGSLGALLFSMLLPWLFAPLFPHFTTLHLILTGLIIGAGGQIGDLVLSYIKRDLGIKDMGSTIAGHGGILDRIDSMVFVAPIFYHMLRWFHGA